MGFLSLGINTLGSVGDFLKKKKKRKKKRRKLRKMKQQQRDALRNNINAGFNPATESTAEFLNEAPTALPAGSADFVGSTPVARSGMMESVAQYLPMILGAIFVWKFLLKK